MEKTAIIAEMGFLYLATLLLSYQKNRNVTEVFVHTGLRSALAIALLLALLLMLADFGAGKEAALLGLAIILSTLVATAGELSVAFEQLITK